MAIEWLRFWIAEIGVPAAMRPITGTITDLLLLSACGGGAGIAALARPASPPSTTLGLKRPRAGPFAIDVSGRRMTSSARARFGRRRMKPRSSSAVIRRWMPDFDFRSSASFISSKDGGMPASRSRS